MAAAADMLPSVEILILGRHHMASEVGGPLIARIVHIGACKLESEKRSTPVLVQLGDMKDGLKELIILVFLHSPTWSLLHSSPRPK